MKDSALSPNLWYIFSEIEMYHSLAHKVLHRNDSKRRADKKKKSLHIRDIQGFFLFLSPLRPTEKAEKSIFLSC